MPARIALLGTGVWATLFHLPALFSSPETDLCAIWARSASSGEKLFSSDAVTSLEQKPKLYVGDEGLKELLANPDIDGALRAGKHVLSEKPLHKDVVSSRSLIEEYERDYEGKGLIWRVAENYAHDPILSKVAEIIGSPAAGPVLFWQLVQQSVVAPGSLFHATPWRTVPDYQGGFILDGGVHMPATLRSVLPPSALPTRIIGIATLHRSHLPPHDTVMALALPSSNSYAPPHGGELGDVSRIPVPSGGSAPTGTVTLTWATPDCQREGTPGSSLEITCLNCIVYIDRFRLSWKVHVKPREGSDVKEERFEGPLDGLRVQAESFARAIKGKGEPNPGEPRAALWDLEFIEAMLKSNAKEIQLEEKPKQVLVTGL